MQGGSRLTGGDRKEACPLEDRDAVGERHQGEEDRRRVTAECESDRDWWTKVIPNAFPEM
jgi:hypothetical protein